MMNLHTALVGDLVVDAAGQQGIICEVLEYGVKVEFESYSLICESYSQSTQHTYTNNGEPCGFGAGSIEPLVKHYTENKKWPYPNYATPNDGDADCNNNLQALTVDGYWTYVCYRDYNTKDYIGWQHTKLWSASSANKETLLKRLIALDNRWPSPTDNNLLKETICYIESLKD
jgi:hypothetical protein